ncbi:sensor histidine kinase [Rossellomorea marisflavi]|nr:HAMP domain-containing sensor histidine kinase [Rossellomorea marisflavi]
MIRTKVMFVLYFIIGLITWLISMGLTSMLTMEVLLPSTGVTEQSPFYDVLVLLTFLINVVGWSILFSWYFGSPLSVMANGVMNLHKGDGSEVIKKAYSRSGRLKTRFRLYKEVIVSIKQLSEDLEKLAKERIKLEKEKKEWMAGISHDLKTPLTYMKGYSALLLNEGYEWSNEETRSFLEEIEKKSNHMEGLINDLSITFQVEETLPTNKELVEMNGFMNGILSPLNADPRFQTPPFSIDDSSSEIWVRMDKRWIERAVHNLLMNAINHNPPDTFVHVQLRTEPNICILLITDNGVGMDEETVKNLFRRYYRGTNTEIYSGTGLGMAIARDLIVANGGTVSVESQINIGTTIKVQLPCSSEPHPVEDS